MSDGVEVSRSRIRLRESVLALAPAVVLLIVLSFIQVTSQSGAGGYDAVADWVGVNAAFDGLDLTKPIVTLAEHYDVTLPAIAGHEESVHPRTPGALLIMSPLALVGPDVAYPLWVFVGGMSTILLLLWVIHIYPISVRDSLIGSLLVVSAGFLVSGSLEFGSLSPLVALLAFAFWRGLSTKGGAAEGLALGVATSLKIYPMTFLLAAIALRRRRLAAWVVVSVVSLNIAGLMLFGDYTIRSYLDVLSLAGKQWIPFSGNLSVAGILVGWGTDPILAGAIGFLLALVSALLLSNWADMSSVFGAVALATLIGWPMVWGHYLILAVPVVAWLAVAKGAPARWLAGAWVVGWVVLPPALARTTLAITVEQTALASLQLFLLSGLWLSHRRTPPEKGEPWSQLREGERVVIRWRRGS